MHARTHLRRSPSGSPLAVAGLVLSFAALHSLLASQAAKGLVERIAGRRARNGVYRVGFIVQSAVATLLAIRSFCRLPDRELYRLPYPWAWGLRVLQVGSFFLLASAVHVTGLRRIMGLPQVAAFLRGETPAPESAAQGPPLAEDGAAMDARGPFRHIRHPDNLPIITLFWSFPRMTVNRLTLAILSSLYAVLGSWHEDIRLRAAYGKKWVAYASRTPMLFPRFGPRKPRASRA